MRVTHVGIKRHWEEDRDRSSDEVGVERPLSSEYGTYKTVKAHVHLTWRR